MDKNEIKAKGEAVEQELYRLYNLRDNGASKHAMQAQEDQLAAALDAALDASLRGGKSR